MKKAILVLLLFLGYTSLQAQEIYNSSGRVGKAKYRDNAQKKGFDPNKLIFGGGLGFGAGSGTLSFGISPIIGYRITDNFAAGISLGYQYNRIKDFIPVINGLNGNIEYYNFVSNMFAGGVWARYIIWENIFIHSEFEYNISSYKDYYTDARSGVAREKVSQKVPCLLLGGGYRQPVGDHLSFVIMGLYDVLQNIPSNQRTDNLGNKYSISPYANRLDIRVGVNIGF